MGRKKSQEELVVGLDIGTSRVLAQVAAVRAGSEIEIVGMGEHPSPGVKRGAIVDIESTVQAIRGAVAEAERSGGCEIKSVCVGIAGSHIRSINSHGVVAIRDREVRPEDVRQVLEAAKAVSIPADQKVLHVLPREYVIDAQGGIRKPEGMSGVRLEAHVHIVHCADSAAQNIVKCVRQCKMEVDDVVLQQLATADAVLTNDEKDLGVCLLDIGGGTTGIAVFTEGSISHTAVIPIAGDQITNDIAIALHMATPQAEDLKKNHGSAAMVRTARGEDIEIPGVGDRPARTLSQQVLAEVIRPRVEELFGLVQDELRRAGFEHRIGSGMVLAGGAARMPGMTDLAEEIFHLPARTGLVTGVKTTDSVLQNPAFATSVGLLLYAAKKGKGMAGSIVPGSRREVGQLWGMFRRWAGESF